jgi:hypothetical protein
MSRDTKFLILLVLLAAGAFLTAVYVLETLLAEQEFIELVITDPVPPWMAAQLQEEARAITEGVRPDDAS